MAKSPKKTPKGANSSLTNSHPNDNPKSASLTEGCDCCDGMSNGLVYCFDGAIQVLPFPTEGAGIPVWVAGVGWVWANGAPLIGPGEGKPQATPQVIPPAVDGVTL